VVPGGQAVAIASHCEDMRTVAIARTSPRGAPGMWWTETGDKTLKGAEWDLFREGVGSLWDEIEMAGEDDDPLPTDIDVFDGLTLRQKLALLAIVIRAVGDESVPSPRLTAVSEGTVAAVYGHIGNMVDMEIDQSKDYPRGSKNYKSAHQWRRLVRAAWSQDNVGVSRSDGPATPRLNNADPDRWGTLVDCLAGSLLWGDEDYRHAPLFMDVDPERGRPVMVELGIDAEYFVAVAPDPTDAELERIRDELRAFFRPPGGRRGAGE
jgi:hypothetical protein